MLITITALLIHLPDISRLWQDKAVLRARLKLQMLQDEADIVPQLQIRQLLSLAPKIPTVKGSSIPKIIHQSYKDSKLPADFKAYRKSWMKHHPSWVYQFWTDEVSSSQCERPPRSGHPMQLHTRLKLVSEWQS